MPLAIHATALQTIMLHGQAIAATGKREADFSRFRCISEIILLDLPQNLNN